MISRKPPKGHKWEDLTKEEPLSPEEKLVDLTFTAVFSTVEGKKALEFMHLLTTWKRNKPDDSDGALREVEAQRRFVASIEARIERYSKGSKSADGGRTERSRRRGPGQPAGQ